MSQFVGKDVKSHLSWHPLLAPKARGSLVVPNLKAYCQACILSRIVDWLCNDEENEWVQVEKDLLEAPFLSILWAPH